jgi:hypothetical protein
VPWLVKELAESSMGLIYLLVINLYITAILFFAALYHTLKLLSCIDKNIAFPEKSVSSLKNIQSCAIISFLYVLNLAASVSPGRSDAPGLIVIGLVIIFASVVIFDSPKDFKKCHGNKVRK